MSFMIRLGELWFTCLFHVCVLVQITEKYLIGDYNRSTYIHEGMKDFITTLYAIPMAPSAVSDNELAECENNKFLTNREIYSTSSTEYKL